MWNDTLGFAVIVHTVRINWWIDFLDKGVYRMKVAIDEQFIEDMKKGIKRNKETRRILNQLVAEGLSEDEALNLMIRAWLERT